MGAADRKLQAAALVKLITLSVTAEVIVIVKD